MSGGARYPYPKQVWAPTGGWWAPGQNGKAVAFRLTGGLIVGALVLGIVFGPKVIRRSRDKEFDDSLLTRLNAAAAESQK
ncbi:hypothetical protein V1514DRAFT_320577 [Lipomyces japonicus]|uniref:uncharacterized protein n=1 Tax=Lipomyces japonicus TaxID=56871 RepID=UPI0034CD8E45